MDDSTVPASAAFLFMGDDITIDGNEPVNVTGGFGDLFAGNHPVHGTLALKRLRAGRRTGASAKEEEVCGGGSL